MKKNYVFAVAPNCIIYVEKSMLEDCYPDYKVIREVTSLEDQMMDLIFDTEGNKLALWAYQMDYEDSTSEWEFIFATLDDMIAKQKHLGDLKINLRYSSVVFF